MGIIDNKKVSRNLLIIILMLYFFVYFGRYSYNVSIVNMISDGILTKTQSGTLTSVFYIIFFIGCFFSAFLSNKKYTYLLLFITALGTAFANLGFYFSKSFGLLLVFYTANAVCQSLMFTPIFTIINTNIQKRHRQIGVKYFSLLYPLSRLLDNIMVILFMLLGSYNYLFLFGFIAIAAMAFLWLLYWQFIVRRQYILQNKKHSLTEQNLPAIAAEQVIVKPENNNMQDKKTDGNKEYPYKDISLLKLISSTGLFIIFAIALLRALMNGSTNTWMPTMIMEVFGTTPLYSQILTLVFPLLNVLGIYLGIYTLKKVKNEVLTAGIYFAVCILPFAGLIFMKDTGFAFSIILIGLVNIFSYSYFVILNSSIASCYRKTGKIAMISSLLNTFGSVGFILSGYTLGRIADLTDWNIIIYIWIGISAAAAALCFIAAKKWGRFRNYN